MENNNPLDGFFGESDIGRNKYANPFYGVPMQYLPKSMDGMLWWADHFLLRFGFYRTSLSRIANYFITQLNIECDDEKSEEKYKEGFEEIGWKEILAEGGLNLLGYSNLFASINQGFDRFLSCTKCNKISQIERINNFKFDKNIFTYTCPRCGVNSIHKVIDKPSRDLDRINVVFWNPREIKLRCEETTGAYEYYWDIPEIYKKKVTAKNDKFFPKKVPMVIYEAIDENKMIVFNKKNFIHLKLATPASLKTDGKAVPLCMYMFDDFFMLKVLERFNEVICYEDINPFRVIAMTANANPGNPILNNQNGGAWSAAVDHMINQHRKDPGSYYKFPFPMEFQQLGGQGKNLAPVELIAAAQNNILNALNIPQELYAMTLQSQAVGPALRLFENSWSCVVDAYNKLLQQIGDVIGKIKGLAPAKITLLPITFADDMERKSVIGQLVSSNSIARSEFLKLYDYDFKDQLRKKMQEDQDMKEIQEEEQERQEIRKANSASIFNQQGAQGGGGGGAPGAAGGMGQADYSASQGSSPQEILAQAQEIAQQLQPNDGPTRRQELQKIKAQNETLWSAVKSQLEQMDSGAKSEGLKASKQQGQQGGQM